MLGLLRLGNLNAAALGALKPQLVLDNYPEYGTTSGAANPEHFVKIGQFAQKVVESLSTRFPIRAVFVAGHADVALRKAVHERAAFEYEVSLHRAESGKELLVAQLTKKAGHSAIQFMVRCDTFALGSANRVVKSPHGEADMRKNRRVEFFAISDHVHAPKCGCNH